VPYSSATLNKTIHLLIVVLLSACLGACSGGGGKTKSLSKTIFSVLLNWDTPLLREDGSNLELYEIDGYVVAYGTDAQNLNTTVSIVGAGETNFLVENLSVNTYYFAIATVGSNGVRGAFSNSIKQTVM